MLPDSSDDFLVLRPLGGTEDDIAGVLPATSGRVHTHGRIAALLELGSGFNPELTGRENIHINGAILGLERGRRNDPPARASSRDRTIIPRATIRPGTGIPAARPGATPRLNAGHCSPDPRPTPLPLRHFRESHP